MIFYRYVYYVNNLINFNNLKHVPITYIAEHTIKIKYFNVGFSYIHLFLSDPNTLNFGHLKFFLPTSHPSFKTFVELNELFFIQPSCFEGYDGGKTSFFSHIIMIS